MDTRGRDQVLIGPLVVEVRAPTQCAEQERRDGEVAEGAAGAGGLVRRVGDAGWFYGGMGEEGEAGGKEGWSCW
jgi:hypothetical protein